MFLSRIFDISSVRIFCILTALRKVTGLSIFAVINIGHLSVTSIPRSLFINTDLRIAKSLRMRHTLLDMFRVISPKLYSNVLCSSASKDLRVHHVCFLRYSLINVLLVVNNSVISIRKSVIAG